VDKRSQRTRRGRVRGLSQLHWLQMAQILLLSNVLKLMKEAEGLSGLAETTTTTKETRVPSRKGVSSPTKRVQELLKKRSDSGSKSTSTSPGKVVKAASQDLMKEYKRAWRVGYASMFFAV
jgi:hypothetical protein